MFHKHTTTAYCTFFMFLPQSEQVSHSHTVQYTFSWECVQYLWDVCMCVWKECILYGHWKQLYTCIRLHCNRGINSIGLSLYHLWPAFLYRTIILGFLPLPLVSWILESCTIECAEWECTSSIILLEITDPVKGLTSEFMIADTEKHFQKACLDFPENHHPCRDQQIRKC